MRKNTIMSYKSNRFSVPHDKSTDIAKGKACYGKFAGFILGAIFGGFWGALLGFAAGHILIDSPSIFRTKTKSTTDKPSPASKSGKSDVYRQKFIRIWCGMIAKMAKADGAVTQEEIAAIEEYLDKVLELDILNKEFAISAFRLAKDSTYSFEHYANDFVALTENDPSINLSVLDMLVRLSIVDGSVNPAEKEILHQAARIFGLSLSEFDSILSSYSQDFKKYYSILGCKESDSDEVIKERFRALAKENHPDTILGKGMPEEFVKFAEKRFKEIQEAFEAISNKRGFR